MKRVVMRKAVIASERKFCISVFSFRSFSISFPALICPLPTAQSVGRGYPPGRALNNIVILLLPSPFLLCPGEFHEC
jgi:hypothetical protein